MFVLSHPNLLFQCVHVFTVPTHTISLYGECVIDRLNAFKPQCAVTYDAASYDWYFILSNIKYCYSYESAVPSLVNTYTSE